jgi:hypothetical protein
MPDDGTYQAALQTAMAVLHELAIVLGTFAAGEAFHGDLHHPGGDAATRPGELTLPEDAHVGGASSGPSPKW